MRQMSRLQTPISAGPTIDIVPPCIGSSTEQMVSTGTIKLPVDEIAYLEELYRAVDNMLDDEQPLGTQR